MLGARAPIGQELSIDLTQKRILRKKVGRMLSGPL